MKRTLRPCIKFYGVRTKHCGLFFSEFSVSSPPNLRAFDVTQYKVQLRHSQSIEMKVYVHYEEGIDPELHLTLKLTLPRKWDGESPMKLLKVGSQRWNTGFSGWPGR